MTPPGAPPGCADWPRNSPRCRRACSACWRPPRLWRTSRRRPSRASRCALDGAPKLLPEAVDRPPFFYHACIALTFAERYREALARFDDALADARRLGSLPHVLGLSCYRALAHLRIGNLADAEADARVALETGPRLPGFHAACALAVLLETLAERGQLKAAEAADARYRLAEQFPAMIHGAWLLAARGRLRLAELRPAAALGDLLTAGDLLARLHSLSSVMTPWRSDAALAHLALGAPAEARALAAEEVTLAQDYHGPRALGIALRAAGLTEGGRRGIELLRQAAGVLEGSDARLEHARALTDLGAALRRAGHRAESRETLRPALDLAHRCGALALTERARTELIAAGGRPRRLVLSGLDSLTPSERRIAQLAPPACPTARSPRTCSSPPGPSKVTSPTPTTSSPSPPASNSPPLSHPPATRPPPRHSAEHHHHHRLPRLSERSTRQATAYENGRSACPTAVLQLDWFALVVGVLEHFSGGLTCPGTRSLVA